MEYHKDHVFHQFFFCLFVSDIPISKFCELSQFAGMSVAKKATKIFNGYVTEIKNWCKKWGLKLDKQKTKNINTGYHKTTL